MTTIRLEDLRTAMPASGLEPLSTYHRGAVWVTGDSPSLPTVNMKLS